MTCRACRWLNVPLNAAGRRVVRKDKVYPCGWPIPEKPLMPDSIIFAQGFHWPTQAERYMAPNEGEHCAVFAALEE